MDLVNEWRPINKGFVPASTLQEWIKEYFNINENLKGFKRRNNGCLELMSQDNSRGYIFWGEIQLDRDVKGRMEKEKEHYIINKRLLREFVDYEQGLAGLSWVWGRVD